MTRETKFGLLLVLTLTTTFGVLVWKKMHQPKDLVATTENAEETGENPAEDLNGSNPADDPAVVNTATPLAAIPNERATPRRPFAPSEDTPRSDPLFATSTPPATPRAKPPLPTDLDQPDFFTAPKNAARVTNSHPTPPVEPDPFAEKPTPNGVVNAGQPDPFGSPTGPTSSAAVAAQEPDRFGASTAENSANLRSGDAEPIPVPGNEPDPFTTRPGTASSRALNDAAEPTFSASPAEPDELRAEPLPDHRRGNTPFPATARNVEPVEVESTEKDPLADSGNEAPVEVSARSTVPATNEASLTVPDPVLNLPASVEPADPLNSSTVAAKEPDPFFVEDNSFAPTPVRPRATNVPRAAAPVAEPDPFGTPAAIPVFPERTGPERVRAETVPLRTPSRAFAPMTFAGETYIVQPNDNFWSISKKVYGTGRYFEALALYNAALVSDPAKMRPGLKIATPTEAELQSRYPKLLATTGTEVTTNDPVSLGLPGDVYIAVSGDNFWEISKRLYGDGKYFRALEQHNAAIVADPQKLKPGMKLAVPKAAWLQAKYPQLVAQTSAAVQDLKRLQPARYQPDEPAGFFVGQGDFPMYRVGTKDTLTDIAQNYLGRSSRWVQIYEMNRDVLTDGNALSVGTVLRLPADASPVAVIENATPRR